MHSYRAPETLPTGHAHSLSDSGSDSSDSDSSSESSSESSDTEEEDSHGKEEEHDQEAPVAMEEDNSTPGWDKVLYHSKLFHLGEEGMGRGIALLSTL